MKLITQQGILEFGYIQMKKRKVPKAKQKQYNRSQMKRYCPVQ